MIVWVCCCEVYLEGYEMCLFMETELQLWLLIHPKAIPCVEIPIYAHTNLFHLFLPAPGQNWGDLWRGFLSLWFVVRCDAYIWLVGQSSYSTLWHLLVILVPDTIILLPCPPCILNLTSLFFLLCSVFHPSTSLSFLLALAPPWIHILPNPWIILPSSPSSLNLCGSLSSPYCHSSCSYTDFSNFMIVSPPCAVPGTTTSPLKTSAAFLYLSDTEYKGWKAIRMNLQAEDLISKEVDTNEEKD